MGICSVLMFTIPGGMGMPPAGGMGPGMGGMPPAGGMGPGMGGMPPAGGMGAMPGPNARPAAQEQKADEKPQDKAEAETEPAEEDTL